MHTRLLAISILICLVIAGLVAGLFAGSIQRALTVPRATLSATKAPMQAKATPVMQRTMTSQLPANPLAQDTFRRTDQQFWGTASDGRAWTGDANSSQAFSIAGTMGQITNGQGTFNALLGPAISANNANVEILVIGSVNNYAQGNANLGVVVRWNDANNWYKALINGTSLMLLKRVNGKSIQLGSVPFPAQNNTTYALRFRAVGAMLFARAWQQDMPEPTTWMLNATDPTFTTGQIGIRVLVQDTTVIKINSFLATAASTTM
jgi:hypothetical protein